MRQLIQMQLNQPLILKQYPRSTLRVGGGPFRLRLLRGGDGGIQHRAVAQRHARLHLAIIGVEDVAMARRGRARAAPDEMLDVAHGNPLLALCDRSG